MIRIFSINQAKKWDEIVKTFAEYDVYYLCGYVKAFMIHGDGEPQLLYYENEEVRAIYVYMKRKTAIEGVYDSITPYGYGGVLFDCEVTEGQEKTFWKEYLKKMSEENIVDNFVRYHPVLANAVPMKVLSPVIDLGKTVAMDLTSPEVIWENIHSKNRNMIRKAAKNGIDICHGQGMDLMVEFIKIYNATMDNDNAKEYYYFKHPFYESIHDDLKNNYEMFYAIYDGKIIAMSILLFANRRLNFHLSGSDIEYRYLAPSNLLLYQAALWGCEKRMKTFHLGGGVGSDEDNLFKFKIAFNKKSDYQFSIDKQIFDQQMYGELVKLRAASDKAFDPRSNFFPLYRS